MNFKKKMQIVAMIILSLLMAVGCGKKEEEAETNQVEAMQEDQGEEAEKADEVQETNSEEEEIEESHVSTGPIEFTGEEMPIQITIPGSEWKSDTNSRDYVDLISDQGVINIMFMEGEGVGDMQVPESQEAYESNVKGIFAGLEFQILDFEKYQDGDRNCYYVVVQYAADNPDKYLVAHGSFTANEGYTVAATLQVDDTETLEALKTSVKSFKKIAS